MFITYASNMRLESDGKDVSKYIINNGIDVGFFTNSTNTDIFFTHRS